jgi:hypothetical protein
MIFRVMSALPPKANIRPRSWNVRYGPQRTLKWSELSGGRNGVERPTHRVEREESADEVDADEERLTQKPCVLRAGRVGS